MEAGTSFFLKRPDWKNVADLPVLTRPRLSSAQIGRLRVWVRHRRIMMECLTVNRMTTLNNTCAAGSSARARSTENTTALENVLKRVPLSEQ
ncbi:hypothetical protein HDF17_002174 [Granulicella arctica]|uniref:Uncharacterized protein n=1 Tax=Granulicella arctica TaxID=940613 RepID=A0A7Y9TGT8_9BACT|nr:hypothetical protein [Granulicella arctica]